MERPKYLVTGGAGFIGSHLVDALLAHGEPVVALDDLSTGSPANLARAREQGHFQFVHGSVLDTSLVDKLVSECDVVVHLAAAVGVKLIVEQPLNSFTINTKGTETVLSSAHRHDRRVIVASTSEIYGKNSSGPLSETSDRVLGSTSVPRWSYSTAKAVDEILAELYRREYGLRSTIVRFFNTVGPRQSPAYGMVIPRFARQAVRGEPITVYGTGQQSRCFLHVADVVQALLSLIDRPDAVGETFNIGSDEEISVLELARRIIACAKSSSPVHRLSYSEVYGPEFEDMERRVPDTTKLRNFTGWKPQRNLEDVLDDAVEDARSDVRRQALGTAADSSAKGGPPGDPKSRTALVGPCPV
ncbi:UDP-glucose 4-epimerase [Streptomyces sp. SLBN-118]|uniref:NAD-dependent epimerase/dehydratase family protein n=1 Tax=Streptomyces sp. SLBN-118 TaxID=2768454 RepID=UPI00114E3C4C|nr:NAD-dependent epimerase/dehydratase family protein [Streptomyces sp. SLBN-118]TQK50655.1 UDP-glucose 4-epimerase [Streptomyces sp. SLBN-118]